MPGWSERRCRSPSASWYFVRYYNASLQYGHYQKRENAPPAKHEMAEKMGDEYSVVMAFYNCGNLYYALNNFSEAENFYELSISKSRECGYPIIYDRAYIKLGDNALKLNNITFLYNLNSHYKNIFYLCKNY